MMNAPRILLLLAATGLAAPLMAMARDAAGRSVPAAKIRTKLVGEKILFLSSIRGGASSTVLSSSLRGNGGLLSILVGACFISYASQACAVDASPAGAPAARTPLESFSENAYIKDRLAVRVEHNYFDWHDDTIRSGRQNITPVTLTYNYNNLDFGLRRALIESTNTSPGREGSVATWSDTSLSASYTLKNLPWPVRFSLDYNLPNGKATLSGSEITRSKS